MILGIPAVDGHELTRAIVAALGPVSSNKLKVVIIDNGSDVPFTKDEFKGLTHYSKIEVIRNERNIGYYAPLLQLHDAYPNEECIGLMHNDVVIYEPMWDERMANFFEADPKLGLVVLVGSSEIDQNGGRGAGTMCFFAGREFTFGDKTYTGQSQAAGARIFGLEPSVNSDSLFMMFRRDVIPQLMHEKDPWKDITLAHFYDRIWPCRTIEAGYRVATLGVECDHIGGLTCVANMRYRNDCIAWLDERGIKYEDPETEMYLVAERRFLGEYRDEKRFLPCIIGKDYVIQHLSR